jgi:hypothetical protein
MVKNLLPPQSPGIEADKRTLILASIKLLLYIVLLSYCLSEFLLLTEDPTVYVGKTQFIAWYASMSAFSLGMILDASLVLASRKQSAMAGTRRGSRGMLLQAFVLPLSPALPPRWVMLGSAAGMALSALSLLTEII